MRATRDEMLMAMATVVAGRGTCDRLQVGAVIARDGRVISSGYNGNIVGMNHCRHDPEGPACTDAVHAEANAILFAARYGVSTEGATLYTTHQPCLNCAKMIINAGISLVAYDHPYRDNSGLSLLLAHPGVEILPMAYKPGGSKYNDSVIPQEACSHPGCPADPAQH